VILFGFHAGDEFDHLAILADKKWAFWRGYTSCMVYYFAPIADGLGDLLITLPALEALIASGVPTYLVIRSPKQEGVAQCIPGLSGSLKEPEFLALTLKETDRYINLRSHPLYLENNLGSDKFINEFGNLSIFDIFERISQDIITQELGIVWDFKKYNPLPFNFRPELKDKILFVPGSAGSFKCWTKEGWIELYSRLKQKGIECFVLGQPEKSKACAELVEAGLPLLKTDTIHDALDVVSSARAMVSIDTGLMHMSIQQKRPTVSLFLARAIFDRHQENCSVIRAPACVEECLKWVKAEPSNHADIPVFEEIAFFDCLATFETRCMNGVTVEQVMSALGELINI